MDISDDDLERARLRREDERLDVLATTGHGTTMLLVQPTGLKHTADLIYFTAVEIQVLGDEIEGQPAFLQQVGDAFVVVARGGPVSQPALFASAVLHRWASTVPATSGSPTDNSICVTCWSIGSYCATVLTPATPDCKAATIPGALSGVAITVNRVWTDAPPLPPTEHEEAYASGTTGADGKWCVTVPITLADPATAPIINPTGGGTSGNVTLAVGTYTAAISYITHYGATQGSPQTAEFQVGIPDPGQYPALAAPLVNQRGTTAGGSLGFGTYFAKVVYRDAAGNHNLPSAVSGAIFAGVPDPTAAPTMSRINPGTSALANGNYTLAIAFANASGETNLSPAAAFTKVAGDLWTVVLPALPPGATSISIYLTFGGGTFGRYAFGVTGATYDLAAAFGFSLPHSGSNTTAGNIPQLTFDALTLRPNATARDLYLGFSTTGPFRLYRSGITALTTDLDIAFTGAGALIPTSNTSLKNIPRATFTPAGIMTRVYAITQPAGTVCQYFEATTSPRDLSGPVTGVGCPPGVNSTGWGTFRVRATSCNQQKTDVVISGFGKEYDVSFGFCCFTHLLNMTDFDSGGAVAATFVCTNNHACTDVGGAIGSPIPTASDGTGTVVGWCWPGLPCPLIPAPGGVDCKGTVASTSADATHGTKCQVDSPGYWSRCLFVASPCDAPTPIVTTGGAKMYSKATFIQNVLCGVCVPGPDRLVEMVRKALHLSFQGPEALTGSAGPVAFTVNFNAALSNLATGHLVWDTGCLGGQGGWGYCTANQFPICYVPTCGAIPPRWIVPDVIASKVLYRSTKVSVIQYAPVLGETNCFAHNGAVPLPTSAIVYQNYWNPGCPAFDPAPPCGYNNALGQPVLAFAGWPYTDQTCPCAGSDAPPAGMSFKGCVYNSYLGVIADSNCLGVLTGNFTPPIRCSCRLCGPVNYAGSAPSTLPVCAGVTPPGCSAILTE